jgi:lysylphosphatidylglycerol synthetase-like protein (DUF2156 family)
MKEQGKLILFFCHGFWFALAPKNQPYQLVRTHGAQVIWLILLTTKSLLNTFQYLMRFSILFLQLLFVLRIQSISIVLNFLLQTFYFQISSLIFRNVILLINPHF